ncbi:MAG: hypothetical protein IT555_00740 [Acetobacteraceae bacterium]|nr:hypothetical protein [Acetobacteraceae bacterium]
MSSLATLFANILTGLRAAIGAHLGRDRTRADLFMLAWARIGRAAQRFQRLFDRWQAGALPRPRPSRAGRPGTKREKPHFPTGRAWLVAAVGYQAAGHASQLQHFLARPDLADFLAAAPQAGRILRPLCRMLGLTPPAMLALPIRPQPQAPQPQAPQPHASRPPPGETPTAPRHGKYTPAQIRRYRPGRMPKFAATTP